MIVPAAIQLDVSAPDLGERIAVLPRAAGIYALETPDHPPHLTWSVNLRSRLNRLLIAAGGQRERLLTQLKENLAFVKCWPTASKLESALLMHALAQRYFPDDYLAKLRLRMPWFVSLSSDDMFPRLIVMNRVPAKSAALLGPFLTRDLAQVYEQSVLNLFQIRRCMDTFVPTPQHPGCIYGEMNQCLRPCQTAVSPAEYATETARLRDFLATNGKSMTTALLVARDRAVEATEFEQAAYLHKRMERVKDAANGRDPVIRDISHFSGIALTHGLGPREFRLWPMLAAHWQEPLTLDFASAQSRSTSLDGELRQILNNALNRPSDEGSRLEELAIFSRWYYSSWRDGHWFPFRTVADLNYRKLVREISKMAKETTEVPVHGQPC